MKRMTMIVKKATVVVAAAAVIMGVAVAAPATTAEAAAKTTTVKTGTVKTFTVPKGGTFSASGGVITTHRAVNGRKVQVQFTQAGKAWVKVGKKKLTFRVKTRKVPMSGTYKVRVGQRITLPIAADRISAKLSGHKPELVAGGSNVGSLRVTWGSSSTNVSVKGTKVGTVRVKVLMPRGTVYTWKVKVVKAKAKTADVTVEETQKQDVVPADEPADTTKQEEEKKAEEPSDTAPTDQEAQKRYIVPTEEPSTKQEEEKKQDVVPADEPSTKQEEEKKAEEPSDSTPTEQEAATEPTSPYRNAVEITVGGTATVERPADLLTFVVEGRADVISVTDDGETITVTGTSSGTVNVVFITASGTRVIDTFFVD